MTPPRLLIVFGTRPEAVKMAPLVSALRALDGVETRVLVTGQHRALLDSALAAFGIVPDIDLRVSSGEGALDRMLAALLTAIGATLDRERPARVLVHGDTLTALAATLAAHLRRVPVAHVEAGLRSGDLFAPWPEEGSRRITGILADLHFAPTVAAADALRRENVPADAIHVTGNTVADALRMIQARIAARPDLAAAADRILARFVDRRIVTATMHRRENWPRLPAIARALARLARRDDLAIIIPLHPNPRVTDPLTAALGTLPNVALVPALDYPDFVRLMAASTLILTDSGGVQEEAPALGVPVLVLRDVTERGEGVAAGSVRLVGTDPEAIVAAATAVLDAPASTTPRQLYGDGYAADRIAAILAARLNA